MNSTKEHNMRKNDQLRDGCEQTNSETKFFLRFWIGTNSLETYTVSVGVLPIVEIITEPIEIGLYELLMIDTKEIVRIIDET